MEQGTTTSESRYGATLTNLFSNSIVGDPWDSEEGDVSEIGRKAFQTCLEAIETTAQRHRSTSVLLYGEPGTGKTHLIRRLRTHLALRRSEKIPKTVFIYIRMETSATMIWRHIRRRMVEDLLRPASAYNTQMAALLMQRLSMPGSRGPLIDEWKREISGGAPLNQEAFAEVLDIILNHIPQDELQNLEMFDQMDGESDLPWELRQALRHVAHRRHETLTRAWLRGDSLAEIDLTRLGISTREDEAGDVEDRAKLVIVALAKFAGPGTPIVLCLDQLEALETPPGDLSGFAAFGRAVSTLHDGTENLVLVSCIQSSYRQSLENAGKANFARIAEFEGLLPLLGREDAGRLLVSRRAFAGNPVGRGEGPLWPFQESDLAEVFDQSGLASARRILSKAAEKFDQDPGSVSEFLESEWHRLMDEAAHSEASDIDQILDDGLKSLANLKGRHWITKVVTGDINFLVRSPSGDVAISLCNQRNVNAFAGQLRRLKDLKPNQRQARLVILRDPRLPIGKIHRATRGYLADLARTGARLIHPSLEALYSLDALRRLLAAAKSGNVTLKGESIKLQTVAEWITAHLPDSLEDFLQEITVSVALPLPQEVSNREDLLDLIEQRCVVPVDTAASELNLARGEVLRLLSGSPDLVGLLDGPPQVLYRLVPPAPWL
jgi:hypothetical protein